MGSSLRPKRRPVILPNRMVIKDFPPFSTFLLQFCLAKINPFLITISAMPRYPHYIVGTRLLAFDCLPASVPSSQGYPLSSNSSSYLSARCSHPTALSAPLDDVSSI